MSSGNDQWLPPANRRLLNASEISTSSRSASLELALMANLTLEQRLDLEAESETAESCLKRLLSIKSVISTVSSFAERQQAASGTKANFREIGTGSIGKIFEHPGTIFVYKLPLLDMSTKLWNNYVMHMRVRESFNTLPYMPGQVEVPRCFWYATPATNYFWNDNVDRFPDTREFPRKPRTALCMERIFPLPKPIRTALISKYCPPRFQDAIHADDANKDCLIRPCLGRVRYGAGNQFFTLRNFKLHANQVRELEMDASELYVAMSHALAVLHWHTRIDANDVEFVLGSSPAEEQMVRNDVNVRKVLNLQPHTSTYEMATHSPVDFTKRITSLWLIDFDDCNEITMNEDGVEMAVKAFMETNFYCPKPSTGDIYIEEMWQSFANKYISYSDTILTKFSDRKELGHLPRQFIKRVEEICDAKKQGSHVPLSPRESAARGEAQSSRQSLRTNRERSVSRSEGSGMGTFSQRRGRGSRRGEGSRSSQHSGSWRERRN